MANILLTRILLLIITLICEVKRYVCFRNIRPKIINTQEQKNITLHYYNIIFVFMSIYFRPLVLSNQR